MRKVGEEKRDMSIKFVDDKVVEVSEAARKIADSVAPEATG